jgi:YD repeat-containing protein
MVAIAGILTAGGRAKSSFARAGFRAGGSNPSNDQNQNTSNTYNAAGSTNTTTNAAGSTSNTVYNAWDQPVSYTVSQSVQIGTDPNTGAPIYETYTQTETVQYDALGRVLGEYESGTFPGEASTIATQHTLTYNALTGQVISDINSTTVSSTAPEGIDPARYVYAPDGNMVLREMGLFGATTPDLYTYALTDPTGTVLAIANSNGSVDERYVFDGLGNAQALQPTGAAYDPTSFANPNRSANWQFQQQFSGSVFDTSTQTLQSEGTDWAWNIVYHGDFYNGIPGVYINPQGEFNPRQQSLLTPDLAAIQQGISAYDPTQGETGFTGWYDRNLGTVGVGISSTLDSPWFSPVSWVLRELGSALNSWGASEASNGSVALGTAGFFLGGLSDTLASLTNPAGSLWNLGEASYTVAQRDGDVAGVAYGLGSLIGATQITEAVAGDDFLTGQALAGLDRWGTAFQGISSLSGVAALGVGVAGQLDLGGLFGRTAQSGPNLLGTVEPPADLTPGTAPFGNAMHARIAQWLGERYPGVKFILRIGPGQTGVDVEVPEENVARIGFQYAEIKPRSASGLATFQRQIASWGFQPDEVQPITYDQNGNIYDGF